jgi:hypothetical protein
MLSLWLVQAGEKLAPTVTTELPTSRNLASHRILLQPHIAFQAAALGQPVARLVYRIKLASVQQLHVTRKSFLSTSQTVVPPVSRSKP